MSLIKSQEEIKKIIAGGKLLSRVLAEVSKLVKPGVTGVELDQLAEKLLLATGGQAIFKGYGQPPFPNALCVSVNSCVVHGIPAKKPLQQGDIVSLDIGLLYQGLVTDMSVTLPVGKVLASAQKLISVTRQSLDQAIKIIKPGIALGDIGYQIQSVVEKNGFGVVRAFVGHGLGYSLHEEPAIPNFGQPGQGMKLRAGMVLAIEPMVTEGDWDVTVADNGWDAMTVDGKLAAHFEHTVIVTDQGCLIATK